MAQINSEIEAEAELEAQKEEVMSFFNDFLAQIGIEDSESLFTQLNAAGVDSDTIAYMATDPNIYKGLAQIANDYHKERDVVMENVWAQLGTEEEDDYAEISEMLAQMDKEELTELHDMLAQITSEYDEAY